MFLHSVFSFRSHIPLIRFVEIMQVDPWYNEPNMFLWINFAMCIKNLVKKICLAKCIAEVGVPVYLGSHIYAVFLFWAGTDFRELLADTCRKLSRWVRSCVLFSGNIRAGIKYPQGMCVFDFLADTCQILTLMLLLFLHIREWKRYPHLLWRK